ncbi:hypothetical protein GCM10022280_11730 [Sphingomonas swuensis]|uniref:SRPBCC family protein n=1 Tax=Sphingomonas swuensis TaxID=977800 RepID=A0ABP7SR85_9SPHN
MNADRDEQATDRKARLRALLSALLIVGGFALGIYYLIDSTTSGGLISFSFLLLLPVALAALICLLADLPGHQPWSYYAKVILLFSALLVGVSVLVLREGVICILMLLPLWMPAMFLGAWIVHRLRRRPVEERKTYCAAFVTLPLAAMLIEPMIPLPIDEAEVSRSAVIAASPEELWPLLEGINRVAPGEGRWNLSQDLIGVPRPLGARLVGQGLGAVRLARWEHGIAFRETITEWRPGRAIGWEFHFDNFRGWDMTDRHLLPDSPHFKVASGGYVLEPLGPRRTRVTLTTRYRMRTPVNAYAEWWGELFLGDLHDNLLALVEQRAANARQAQRVIG